MALQNKNNPTSLHSSRGHSCNCALSCFTAEAPAAVPAVPVAETAAPVQAPQSRCKIRESPKNVWVEFLIWTCSATPFGFYTERDFSVTSWGTKQKRRKEVHQWTQQKPLKHLPRRCRSLLRLPIDSSWSCDGFVRLQVHVVS